MYPELLIGDIIWNAGSLHVYERHWWLLECYARFGRFMTRKEYDDAVIKKLASYERGEHNNAIQE